MGLSPQRYLCNFNFDYNLHDSKESEYDSWVEVGELLAAAVDEFGHEQDSQQSSPSESGARSVRQRALAG